mmetsp:Transcript_61529/g.170604  ORF Transcript_61529/g.170604 Transcript_61529/m.170604 type:complete len:247 (-) Transcript_61529:7-747(-)
MLAWSWKISKTCAINGCLMFMRSSNSRVMSSTALLGLDLSYIFTTTCWLLCLSLPRKTAPCPPSPSLPSIVYRSWTRRCTIPPPSRTAPAAGGSVASRYLRSIARHSLMPFSSSSKPNPAKSNLQNIWLISPKNAESTCNSSASFWARSCMSSKRRTRPPGAGTANLRKSFLSLRSKASGWLRSSLMFGMSPPAIQLPVEAAVAAGGPPPASAGPTSAIYLAKVVVLRPHSSQSCPLSVPSAGLFC